MGKKTWGQPNFFPNVIRLKDHYQPLLNVIIALATTSMHVILYEHKKAQRNDFVCGFLCS